MTRAAIELAVLALTVWCIMVFGALVFTSVM